MSFDTRLARIRRELDRQMAGDGVPLEMSAEERAREIDLIYAAAERTHCYFDPARAGREGA